MTPWPRRDAVKEFATTGRGGARPSARFGKHRAWRAGVHAGRHGSPLRLALACAFLSLAAAGGLRAQQTVLPPKPDTSDWIQEGTNCTVITSRRLSLDQEQRRAVFEENVLVVDGDLTLTADKMTVFMSPSNTVETIQAEGRIHATQGDRVALARRADYDGREGKIVLTGDPKLQQGRDILKGDTITFWTAHRRVVCEPNAVMVIYSEHGASRDSLLGATPDE